MATVSACRGLAAPPLLLVLVTMAVMLLPAADGRADVAVCVRYGVGERAAGRLAERHGYRLLHRVLGDCYLLRRQRLRRSAASRQPLRSDPRVTYAAPQRPLRRVKRDPAAAPARPAVPGPPGRERRDLPPPSDPLWPQMWYLNGAVEPDMGVRAAWRRGWTGRGVTVAVLDDGLEHAHPDLADNYAAAASYDINDDDADPAPRYDTSSSNRHGTRCAGVVAARAGNAVCGRGAAFDAGVGGVRMLDGEVTDAVEARALSRTREHVDVFVSAWGPDDDGRTVDGPGPLARAALEQGVAAGRGGLGSVFVWGSGNGGRDGDDCGADGYAGSRFTLTVSAAAERGGAPWYAEPCAASLAAVFSSGGANERRLVTTDLHGRCTVHHTGTGAATPLAAALVALALQARPELSWRDVQHLVVRTARPAQLSAHDWAANGVGRRFSHWFGYGLMDATALTELAANWSSVPAQRSCEVAGRGGAAPPGGDAGLTVAVPQCDGVGYLEHVQVVVSAAAARRGDLELVLTSPAGTASRLLRRRPRDYSRDGLQRWTLLSVHFWDEPPAGLWRLTVHNSGHGEATVTDWTLRLFGIEHQPNGLPPPPPPPPPPSPTVTVDVTTTTSDTPNDVLITNSSSSHTEDSYEFSLPSIFATLFGTTTQSADHPASTTRQPPSHLIVSTSTQYADQQASTTAQPMGHPVNTTYKTSDSVFSTSGNTSHESSISSNTTGPGSLWSWLQWR